MRPSRFPVVVLVLALSLFGLFAWMSRDPDAALFRAAERLPAVGGSVGALRAAFKAPAEPLSADAEDLRKTLALEATESLEPPWEGPPAYVWALAGANLRVEPSGRSEVVRSLRTITHLPRLEQRGDWHRVWHYGGEAWVYLKDYGDHSPPLGSEPDPPLPMDPRSPDPERLARARELLGERERELRLGAYPLYTDVVDDAYLSALDAPVRGLEQAYTRRYGLVPKGSPREAIVLFARRSDFMRLQSFEGLGGLPAAGHAVGGLAVIFVGDRAHHEVTSTVLHELIHLINRRAIGPSLPPWLDEGLCDDLSNLRLGPGGRLDPSGLSGLRYRRGGRMITEGALASLQVTAQRARRQTLPSLERLLSLDWDGFVRSSEHRMHYDASALWIRSLLHGAQAAAFRGFLSRTSRGEPIDPEALRRSLGGSWSELDAAYWRWLESQAGDLSAQPAGQPPASDSSSRHAASPSR
ncbi:MAG: SH3 domain-containing protein [Acidobacteriota bacterium]